MNVQRVDRQLSLYNTNEIPSELSRENLISSHVKITCYFKLVGFQKTVIVPQLVPAQVQLGVKT